MGNPSPYDWSHLSFSQCRLESTLHSIYLGETDVRNFETQDEFLDAIEKEWRKSGSHPEDALRALRGGLKDADIDMQDAERAADGSLDLRLKNWILREEDIPVIEAIGIVSAAALAALAPEVIAAAVVVTALTSFATICWKAWRKGAWLSKNEIAVLGFLQIHGPMYLEELKHKAAATVDDLSENDVELALQSLTDVEFRDGNIVELVRKDASGRWRPRPV